MPLHELRKLIEDDDEWDNLTNTYMRELVKRIEDEHGLKLTKDNISRIFVYLKHKRRLASAERNLEPDDYVDTTK
jgi:hypothetical protein